jgi:hypothetical protein
LTLLGRADLDLYESKEAWPRAFFTNDLRRYETVEELVQMIRKGEGRPFAAIQGGATIAPGAPAAPEAERRVVPAANYRLTTNSTQFTITAPSAGVAALTECYEDGNFIVTINDAPAQCFRINHAFKGVWLDRSGEYRIRFTYWPRLLTPALWLSGLGLALALASAAAVALISRRTPDGSKPANRLTAGKRMAQAASE